MTGYGRSSTTLAGLTIDVSVKSVNGRYLEIRTHLPKKYVALEAELIKEIKRHFSRGTVDIYVQRMSAPSSVEAQLRFNGAVAKKWLSEYRKVLKELKVPDTLSARDLLAIPDFMQYQDSSEVSAKEGQSLIKAVKAASEKCQSEREREGEALRKTCLRHLQGLNAQITQLQSLRETFVAEAPRRVGEKIKKLTEGVALDEQRLVQEIAHIIDRSDIDEEIARFQEHVDRVEELLKSKESHGKKLDFYAQELLREINTIGSKSPSAKMTENVVSAKNVIEQLREQIQNIE